MSDYENQENTEINCPYPEVDLSNPRKDGESWPSTFQQGDQDAPEAQMGQYDDSESSRQRE